MLQVPKRQSTGLKAELQLNNSAPVHHKMKVSGTLCMELYRSAQDDGIERTDLFS